MRIKLVQGNYHKTVDYYKWMVSKANVTKDNKGNYKNHDYKLTSINGEAKNCMTVSFEGLKKGTLKDGTSVGNFVQWDGFESIRPNDFRVMIRESFANQQFTKSAARQSAIGTINVKKPWYMSYNYYDRGQTYGRMLRGY